jgi:hypothetical protein
MTFGPKKTSYIDSQVNRNQGGGSKKAGFPYQVGRTSWTNIYFDMTDPVSGKCVKLPCLQKTLFPNVRPSRGIGSSYSANYRYYHMPGMPK